MNDMVQVANPTLPFLVLQRVLEREEAVRGWMEKEMARVAKARARLASSPLLDFPAPAGGVTLFARFPGVEDTGELCRFLAEEKGVHLVPGAFFGDPSRVRIGLALAEEALDRAVRALLESLEEEKMS
ncbi:MAG TPA: aminotransferase class I/II-fold pyridoxal phosphate-dependent enzyme [Planctomycetes bacterium]|nr:aminotransferase class I/II-fold pyridoxal phosphate-dependent enzyme [Planctomycetota bacterium]